MSVSDTVWVNHDGLIQETKDASRFRIKGKRIWIPKSVIVDNDGNIVGLQPWWAKKNRIGSDW